MQESILSKLEASRKELLDLGLRNPLLNFRPLAAKGLHIVHGKSSSVYDLLVVQGKALTFAGKPTPAAAKKAALAQPDVKESPGSDTKLRTEETETALQHKLLNTYYTARTGLEEQGVNTLFLALGMLRWFESESSEEGRLAPLVLVPVMLERSSARERFALRYTGQEIGENLSLQAKLKAEFGVVIPDMPADDDFSIEAWFEEIEKTVADFTFWKVERDAIELGFFSFGKFMIYNDLDSATWPEDAQPAAHPLVQSLLETGFKEPQPATPEDAFIDNETNAGELFQVVDADSSQLLALLAVHEGRNLIIQGPPGTGKSQTITNIIANAIGQGKKVLFVAEKMAALEVVKRRLDSANLGEACLELHSHKANKKELHQEIRRVMELEKPAIYQLQQEVALLQKHKDELNAYSQAINSEIGKSGLTAQKIIGYLLQLGPVIGDRLLPKIPLPGLQQWDAHRMQAAEALAGRIEARLQETGVPVQLLFWGSRLRVLLPHDQEALGLLVQTAVQATEALEKEARAVAGAMGLALPANREESIRLASCAQLASGNPGLKELTVISNLWLHREADIRTLLQTGKRLNELYTDYEKVFLPEAWKQDVMPIREELVAHGHKWYNITIGSYNKAVKQLQSFCKSALPKKEHWKLNFVDAILEAKRLQTLFSELEPLGTELFGNRWQGLKSNWESLSEATEYLIQVYQQVASGTFPIELINYLSHNEPAEATKKYGDGLLGHLNHHGKSVQALVEVLDLDEAIRFSGKTLVHLPFEPQLALLARWRDRLPEIHEAISWNNLADKAHEEELPGLIAVSIDWPEAKDFLKITLQRTWYEHLLQQAVTTHAILRQFERTTHEEVIREFKRLDVLNFQYNRACTALKHYEAIPPVDAGGQVTVLRTEFNKKARHLPIRKLMQEAGLAIQAVKPVFMMSPLSIASFLPPGAVEFDLVIFDEASQVRPVEALGALLRAKQMVVVGDAKQLPPTSFFDTLNNDWDEETNVTADMPSILGLCDAQGAPQRMLRWHYRSRHESLIHLSNHEFYENKLVVFPSPGLLLHTGLVFHHLKDAVYDRGKTRTNAKEAAKVVDAIIEHAHKHPKLSLGVVAFSSAQRQAIQDALEAKRKKDPEAEAFFKRHAHEPFFIKNLENVQGDERDVIFISIGYGRTAEGLVSMSFGPLNNEGGEKRLNVLITRARLRCEVFTNITADDINTARTQSYGIKALKSFLHYAQHGKLNVPQVAASVAGSPFEEVVAEQLTSLGYIVHKQVGSQGFFLDLAIVDPETPGRYVLGIECDGAAYHSARSARDRDRLRQQVLEGMGWRIHRIWSTDWFRNPVRELKRVVDAIDKAWQSSLTHSGEVEMPEVLLRERVTEDENNLPHYRLATIPEEIATQDIQRQPVGKLAALLEEVVQVESPVHFDEVARRIVEAAGITRVGPRVRDHLRLAAKFAQGGGRIQVKGDFLWHNETQGPVLRNRSQFPSAARKMKYIAPEEINLAIHKVVRDSVAIVPEAAVPCIARLFGFSRVTEDIRNDLLEMIRKNVEEGLILQEGELLKAGEVKVTTDVK